MLIPKVRITKGCNDNSHLSWPRLLVGQFEEGVVGKGTARKVMEVLNHRSQTI